MSAKVIHAIQLGTCINTVGGYNCACPAGYVGNGINITGCFPASIKLRKLSIGNFATGFEIEFEFSWKLND